MTDSAAASEGSWSRADPRAGLSVRQVWLWMLGRTEERTWKGPGGPRTLEMEATPYGWQGGGPPYHWHPVPSPLLVPVPLRPVWALFYYLPGIAIRRVSADD